jgi:DNA modification methylase
VGFIHLLTLEHFMIEHQLTAQTRPCSLSRIRNTFVIGNCQSELDVMTSESVDLCFTSPPYYNARPEYQVYRDYDSYLAEMQAVINKVHRVLKEGRMFVINASPIIIPRRSRSESSVRFNIPADIHHLFGRDKWDFIDDIVWVKPEGAGCGRGRGFARHRQPLQYKTVPVTESLLVYRKKSARLIDWFIRTNRCAAQSKIAGTYDRTNVWQLPPARNKVHPAVFPVELAEKVIRYYSFVGDVVLDPFAGIGTVGFAALKHKRRFILIEQQREYAWEFERVLSNLDREDKLHTPTFIIQGQSDLKSTRYNSKDSLGLPNRCA